MSAEARRKVCTKLAIMNADPLVALYEQWPGSRAALDPDGHFISSAPKFYREAAPEVRQACSPIAPVLTGSELLESEELDEIANRQPRPSALGSDWKIAEREAGRRRRRGS